MHIGFVFVSAIIVIAISIVIMFKPFNASIVIVITIIIHIFEGSYLV